MSKNHIDPYSKKRIMCLRLNRRLESHGCHLFSLDACKETENKCSLGIPAILIRGLISGPGFVFLNMSHSRMNSNHAKFNDISAVKRKWAQSIKQTILVLLMNKNKIKKIFLTIFLKLFNTPNPIKLSMTFLIKVIKLKKVVKKWLMQTRNTRLFLEFNFSTL